MIINSVDRALTILSLFSRKSRELGISEISQLMGLPKSTVHGLVKTLAHRGFLAQNPDNGRYRLGLKVYELGMAYSTSMELQTVARPVAQKLAEKYEKPVHMAIYAGGKAVFIMRIEHRENLMSVPRSGISFPAHSTASGKVLLANLTEADIERYAAEGLYPVTARTITDKVLLVNELEQIRLQGYAVDNEETQAGVGCVAAPVRDGSGHVVAAVSLSGYVGEIFGILFKDIAEDVKEAALQISRTMGYLGNS